MVIVILIDVICQVVTNTRFIINRLYWQLFIYIIIWETLTCALRAQV